MRALWRIGSGRVDEVRQALPKRSRSAYTTVQTVLNRLADRGLLSRSKDGKAIVYRVKVDEAEYLTNSLARALSGASDEARKTAIAHLVGELDGAEQKELRRIAREIAERRGR